MSAQLRQLLRGGMERFVEDVRPPAGLALRAYQHRRKRRLAARAATAAGVAAALTAVGVAGLTGAFGPGNGQQIQTTAYITHVQHALASQAGGGLVGYSRDVLPSGTVVEPEPGSWKVLPGGGRSLRSGVAVAVAVMIAWSYQNESALTALDAAGQPVAAEQNTVNGRHAVATVAVNYRDRAWWRATVTLKPGARTPVQPSCFSPGVLPESETWQSVIRQELRCGAYTENGRQRVDGIDAIKLTGSNGVVLWIDPATYLPVRQAGPGARVTDFRWFRATPASLAKLKVAIPPGFRRVPPPRP
jgi:hypothetical protein